MFLVRLRRNPLQPFKILLQVGVRTGLIFILRWFWWRINAYSEIAAMLISFVMALYLELIHPTLGFSPLSSGDKLLWGVGVTTVGWLLVTLLTPPTDRATLRRFYRLVHPGGPGWRKVVREAQQDDELLGERTDAWDVPWGILCMFLGVVAVYSALFATGQWIYGQYGIALVLTALTLLASYLLFRAWSRIRTDPDEVISPEHPQ